jgi:hypothetical protein
MDQDVGKGREIKQMTKKQVDIGDTKYEKRTLI